MKNKKVPQGTRDRSYPVITAQLVRAQLSYIFKSGVVGGGGGLLARSDWRGFPLYLLGGDK